MYELILYFLTRVVELVPTYETGRKVFGQHFRCFEILVN